MYYNLLIKIFKHFVYTLSIFSLQKNRMILQNMPHSILALDLDNVVIIWKLL